MKKSCKLVCLHVFVVSSVDVFCAMFKETCIHYWIELVSYVCLSVLVLSYSDELRHISLALGIKPKAIKFSVILIIIFSPSHRISMSICCYHNQYCFCIVFQHVFCIQLWTARRIVIKQRIDCTRPGIWESCQQHFWFLHSFAKINKEMRPAEVIGHFCRFPGFNTQNWQTFRLSTMTMTSQGICLAWALEWTRCGFCINQSALTVHCSIVSREPQNTQTYEQTNNCCCCWCFHFMCYGN